MDGYESGSGHARSRRVEPVEDPLKAYAELLEKLDAFFRRVLERYGAEMRCAPGCTDCCQRSLCLFPFEVERMLNAAERLSGDRQEGIVQRARRAADDPGAACPFLCEGLCLIYEARPVICRTHGLPMLVEGEESLSMCVYNLKNLNRLDGDCVLDLGPVNRILATINHLVASRRLQSPERVRVSDAILKRLEKNGKMGSGNTT